MKLAMRLPEKPRPDAVANDDPREGMSAEIIDLASRTAYPAVAGRKGKSDAIGLAAGVAMVALLGAATLWGLNAGKQETPQTAAVPAPAPVEEVPFVPGQDMIEPSEQVAVAMPQGDPAPSPVLSRDPSAGMQMAPAANPYASPTLLFDSAGAGSAQSAGLTAPSPNTDAPTGGGAANEFAQRIGGMGGGPAVAAADIQPATTVAQGTMIPAILETAINTDVPGYVRAVVSQDVRSFDGRNVLVPRSSRLIGQYQSGLQQGQKRAYVIWTRLIRPDGVSVALQSPATAFDGSGGLPGKVDGHFFQRFGSAMLLSVIGGLTTVASGGASVILGGGQSAASTALQQNGTIAPTVRVRPGEPIRVVAARDLDFSRAPRVN